jgi:crossover junction endodeoxyribonuclease RusA
MTVLEYFIPGEPVPCARPRLGKYGNIYTPSETQKYEKHVAQVSALWAMHHRWERPEAKTPLQVTLTITRSKARGDIDNIAKSVLDGITKSKRVWVDDRSVTELRCVFDATNSKPGVVVRIAVE